jgi:hypothetical protein
MLAPKRSTFWPASNHPTPPVARTTTSATNIVRSLPLICEQIRPRPDAAHRLTPQICQEDCC